MIARFGKLTHVARTFWMCVALSDRIARSCDQKHSGRTDCNSGFHVNHVRFVSLIHLRIFTHAVLKSLTQLSSMKRSISFSLSKNGRTPSLALSQLIGITRSSNKSRQLRGVTVDPSHFVYRSAALSNSELMHDVLLN
jgi:hypothetical protein